MDKFISFYGSRVPFISGVKYRITNETPTHYISQSQQIPKCEEHTDYITGEIINKMDIKT